MMYVPLVSLLCLSLSFALAFATGFYRPQIPDNAAGRQFGYWLEYFNRGDEQALLAYHDANIPYHVVNSQDLVSIDGEVVLRKKTGGYQLKEVQNSNEHGFTALLQERKSDRFASVTIRVDTTPLQRVVQFDHHPTKIPERFWSPKEREARRLDAEKRSRLVTSVATKIEESYAGKGIAMDLGASLRANLESGKYDGYRDAEQLAMALQNDTMWGTEATDRIWPFFSWPPDRSGRDDGEHLEWLRVRNFGFWNTTRHSHGIASVEIIAFTPSDTDTVRDEISQRMSALADATALILDLRRNGGGSSATLALVASYLFGEDKTHLNSLYRPKSDTAEEFWTDPAVKGDKFGPSKPLYILTSSVTGLEGEEFAYDLQVRKRGVVVGETTRGAARPYDMYVIEPWFLLIMPSKYPINPVTGTNWEGVGVVPDIQTPVDRALDEALRRAEEDLGVAGLRKDDGTVTDEVPAWEEL